MRAEYKIYRNLHKDCFSVLKYNDAKRGYRLHAHEKDLIAQDVILKVMESGRQKVLKEKRKNVHAFVMCQNYSIFAGNHIGEEVYYNPYKMDSFQVKSSGEPIKAAGAIIMTNNKCYLHED
jgi:hypothetical protein